MSLHLDTPRRPKRNAFAPVLALGLALLAIAPGVAATLVEGHIACEVERGDAYNNDDRIERPSDGDLDIRVNHYGFCKVTRFDGQRIPGVTMTSETRAFLGPESMCLVAPFPASRSISSSEACYEFPGDLAPKSIPANMFGGTAGYLYGYEGDFFGSVRCPGNDLDCRQGGIIYVVTFVTFSTNAEYSMYYTSPPAQDPFEVVADPYGRDCADSPPIATGYRSFTCALTNSHLTTGYYPVPPTPEEDPVETARRNVDQADDTAEDNGVPTGCNSPMCP